MEPPAKKVARTFQTLCAAKGLYKGNNAFSVKGNNSNNYSGLADINVDYRGQTQQCDHSDTDACSLGDPKWVLKQSLTRLSLFYHNVALSFSVC